MASDEDRAAVEARLNYGTRTPPGTDDEDPSVAEAWRSDAGARVFNLITTDWEPRADVGGLFRARVRLAKRVLALLLEEGWRPKAPRAPDPLEQEEYLDRLRGSGL